MDKIVNRLFYYHPLGVENLFILKLQ